MADLVEFKLPQTSEDVDESVIVLWYKSEGESVQSGELLVEVQTEKATFELEAPITGVVREIRVGRAAVAQVGDVLAVIDPVPTETQRQGHGQPQNQAQASEPKAPDLHTRNTGKFIAMPPRLRRLAQELGVDPSQVTGTGTGGRITEDDLRRTAAGITARTTVGATLSATRRTIAQRMKQSLQNSAQLTLHAWADVTALSKERKGLYPEASWNDWVLRATVLALQEHPVLNSVWTEDGVVLQEPIHLGIAVDTEDGLMVPVLMNAHNLTLQQLHELTAELSDGVREHKLSASQLSGSTFTVTNLGIYGIEFFTPILNPPESAILGVGQVEEILAVREGEFEVRQRIPLSLTIDHQVVDGGPAARFLHTMAKRLAEPQSLI